MKTATQRQARLLTMLFTVTYMVSYMTRINYGTIVSEMERDMQISKSLLSMALTGSFITYGAGQIISGICGDRFSPKKLVTYGLGLSVCMNLLIPVCRGPWQMLAVWCVNGFAQAFMWPPLVRMMTGFLSEEDYKKVTVKVSWGSSFGTIAMYLLSPVLIRIAGWRSVFVFSAVCGVVMLLVWNRSCPDIAVEKRAERKAGSLRTGNVLLTPLMLGIFVVIALQGMLRDGVTTWMPSYISETYQMSNLSAILSGVILPLFSILSTRIAAGVYRRYLTNPVLCAGALFGMGLLSAAALLLCSGRSAAAAVLLMALLTGCMHGVNLMLISMLPAYFKRFGNVSTVSGLLNAFTYIGSAVSTYGIALISENYGWHWNLVTWLLICVAGTALSLLCVPAWSRRMQQSSEK